MLEIVKTKRFTKSLRKIRHKKNILSELVKVVELLQSEQALPKKYNDHDLKGKFSGIRELHLGFDDLLLYFVKNDQGELVLFDIGTHAHTLGT